jgi:hypothetical protein
MYYCLLPIERFEVLAVLSPGGQLLVSHMAHLILSSYRHITYAYIRRRRTKVVVLNYVTVDFSHKAFGAWHHGNAVKRYLTTDTDLNAVRLNVYHLYRTHIAF